MAHPYFVFASIVEDIPRINEESDKDMINRLGEDSDNEIDNELPQPQFSVPLSTVPAIITIASNKRTEGKYFMLIGEKTRGEALILASIEDVKKYILTYKRTVSETYGVVDIQDGTYNDFKNSPLLDGEFTA
jgi:hypothetical protein